MEGIGIDMHLYVAAVVLGSNCFELVEQAQAGHSVSVAKCYNSSQRLEGCDTRDLAEEASRQAAVKLSRTLWRLRFVCRRVR